MLKEFLLINLDIVFLFYGFFFILMGLCIAVQVRKKSVFNLASILWLLAVFGVVHGINEWLDMIALWRSGGLVLREVRYFVLLISYVFLLEFGRRLMSLNMQRTPYLSKWLTVFLTFFCLALTRIFKIEGSIFFRYFLGLPGGLLTGIGFIKYYNAEKKLLEPLKIKKYFYALACSFIAYAILGGIFTPKADFFPASVFNYENFIDFIGIPLQVFRGICAAMVAWNIWFVLGIFNWEYSFKLLTEISKRKEVEKDLQLFRDIIDQSNDAMFVIDPKTSRFLDFNTKARESLGYTKEKMYSLGVIDIERNIKSLEEWKEHAEELKKIKEMIFVGEHERFDGSSFPVEVSIKSITLPEGDYMISVARDLSERKQAQEYFKKLFEQASEGIFIINEEGNIVLVNKTFAKMHGYTIEEITHLNLSDLDTPETAKLIPERLRRVIEGESVQFEVSHYHKDGSIIALEVAANLISINNQKLIIGFHRNITERKKIVTEFKRQKEFIELVIDALEYPFYVINIDYTIVLANKAARDKGVQAGMDCFKSTHQLNEPCQDEHSCPLRAVIEKRKSVVFEHIHTDQYGKDVIVEVHGDPIFNEQGDIVQMIEYAINVTDRKKSEQALAEAYEKLKLAQEEIIQSGKMAAMGQLAAGISHELNQPLAGIKVLAQNILRNSRVDTGFDEDLRDIIHQADRMDKIITNVRFFSRKSSFKMEELNIKNPIDDALKLLGTQLALNDISVEIKLDENLPKIKGDANQLQQIFINLLTNSKDAICAVEPRRKGIIKIFASFDEEKNSIDMIFEDNGCGIKKKFLNDIFNPFFTTKAPDRGMGLGLSIVYRIIESHDGHIEIESEESKWTKVSISLPIYSYSR